MKKLYSTLLSMTIVVGLAAQGMPQTQNDKADIAVKTDGKAMTGLEYIPNTPLNADVKETPVAGTLKASFYWEEVIGNTQYDLQSNASSQNRFIRSGDDLHAAWTMSWQTSPFSDRGTGYTTSADAGLSWPDGPTERLESERIGWPSMIETESGRLLTISHEGDFDLHMVYKDPGDAEWSNMTLPNDVPEGILWPRAVAGGASGDYIHLIAITAPEANQTDVPTITTYGIDGAILYYRSADQGDTWELQDVLLEQMDSTQFLTFGADAYSIFARGDKVAFASFNDWQDSFVMISEDNGDNWEKTTLVDFPIDLFPQDDEILDLDEDELADTVTNADGGGTVFIDQMGMTHVTFGNMRYLDETLGDDQWSYFPFTDGLKYWNESYGPDSSQFIAFAEDVDDSGVLELSDDIGTYFLSMCGFPTMADDDDGNLYVVYSGVVESHTTGAQNFRHLYGMSSDDGGTTWTEPIDITPDYEFIGYEAIYPWLVPHVDDKLHLIYQRDQEPGLHVRGDQDPVDLNDIVYYWITPDFDLTIGVEEEVMEITDVAIFPNPANDLVQVVMPELDNATVQLFDIAGKLVMAQEDVAYVAYFEVGALAPGLYNVSIEQDGARRVEKLIIE